MLAFDQSYGPSFLEDVELFVMRTWKPVNSVKVYTYDFNKKIIDQIYEVPVSADNLTKI